MPAAQTHLLDIPTVEKITGVPFAQTAQACHHVSLAIVQARILPDARVARGTCQGVFGQHSWIVVGNDCYDPDAQIIDPTLWSYDKTVTGIWHGTARDGRHRPHGAGSIWDYGKPVSAGGPIIRLTPRTSLSAEATFFLGMLGPLDRTGWSVLAHAPVEQWPSGEIFAAMADTAELRALIPIDILGMTTDRNPSGLYLPEEIQQEDGDINR